MKNNLKKKVAILYSGGRYFGGIEQYLIDLFDNVDKNDLDLELLSLGDWPLTERLTEKKHSVIKFSSKRINLKSVKLMGDYLNKNNFDLLVSQGTISNAYARLVSSIYKIPNLVTVHSNPAGDYANPAIRTVYGLVDRFMRRPTDKYIAVSNYIKDQMIKNGVAADKIDVIYNGVDFHNPKPKSHKDIIIGSAGRLHPTKGYDLLLQAFAKLQNKDVLLKIAGEGPELDRLKDLAKSLDIQKRVEFVGFKKDIYEFLNSIDIYAQTSTHEGFGLLAVEAMSQALPVVVTPVGSLKEIVKDNETGLIAADLWPESIADVLDKLISDSKLAKKLGEKSKKFVVENFSVEKWVKATVKTYGKAIK